MTDHKRVQDMKPLAGPVVGLAAAGALALIAGLAAFAVPRPADALPAYAQQTGLACGRCHVNPAGGGARTAFGNAFLANGHKVPSGSKTGKPKASGAAPPSPSTAVTVAPTTVFDYAQAQAWSLRHPYYSHFLYSPDDYRK